MRNLLSFNYVDSYIGNALDYPGGHDSYIYIIFEIKGEYIDNPDKKVYMPYDGFMNPLPKFDSWDSDFKKKIIMHCERKLSGFGGEVWIDDVRIK